MTQVQILTVRLREISGFYQPKISECLCNQYGSVDGQCDPTLKDRCKCKQTFDGAYCDVCSAGYFDFPNCSRKFMAKHFSGILKNILCV